MTEDERTRRSASHGEAVELPWCRTDTGEIVENDPDGEYIIAEAVRVADADLIVEAVNVLPDLIDEVRRLQWEVARLQSAAALPEALRPIMTLSPWRQTPPRPQK